MYERDTDSDLHGGGAGMWYREFRPAVELRPFVRYYWAFQTNAGVPGARDEIYEPSAFPILLFHVKGTFRRGSGDDPCGRPSGDDPCGPPSADCPLPPLAAFAAARRPIPVTSEGADTLRVGVCLRAGAPRALGLFTPADVRGIGGLHDCEAGDLLSMLAETRVLDGPATVLDGWLRRRIIGVATPDWNAVEGPLLACNGRLTMNELAGLSGGSLRGLQRACRRETGYTPTEYRSLVRCDLARLALCRAAPPDLSDLACGLGFFDLPHFCRTFKRWVGMTPSQYSRSCVPFHDVMANAAVTRRYVERSGLVA